MQLDLGLGLPDKQRESKKKIELMCKHCEHSCHCSSSEKCSSCACLNCEHNALDDFYHRLENGKKEIKK
jgi:hypothetical protein